ncbi:MAG: universal stress protein [Aggregatilineales bacterium]
MYQTIVVPLDGSPRAEAILPHVEELARCHKARVVFVRVVDLTGSLSGLEGLPIEVSRELIKQRVDEAESYLEAKQGEFRQQRIEAVGRVRYGPIVQTIAQVVAEENADLVAIASHGRSGLARMFYGSVAAGLLQRIDRPMLIVRAPSVN